MKAKFVFENINDLLKGKDNKHKEYIDYLYNSNWHFVIETDLSKYLGKKYVVSKYGDYYTIFLEPGGKTLAKFRIDDNKIIFLYGNWSWKERSDFGIVFYKIMKRMNIPVKSDGRKDIDEFIEYRN